jgi:ABC-type uncharacterized transport system substrate-binding protein
VRYITRIPVPAIYEFRHLVVAGGLFSYGPESNASYRQATNLVGRILNGERPSDLPLIREITEFFRVSDFQKHFRFSQ